MAHHIDVGNQGEQYARNYLEQKEYNIAETNWRFQKAEIDIIAWHGDILVFVEVKTRSSSTYGDPAEAIDRRKEALLCDAGAAYMRKIQHEWEFRFDVISVVLHDGGAYELEHVQDAFFPSL